MLNIPSVSEILEHVEVMNKNLNVLQKGLATLANSTGDDFETQFCVEQACDTIIEEISWLRANETFDCFDDNDRKNLVINETLAVSVSQRMRA